MKTRANIRLLMTAVLGLTAGVAAAAPRAQPATGVGDPFEGKVQPAALSEIDRLVFARLRELGIEPSRPCSDAVFLRRVYLDVIGKLPTADEARTFLESHAPRQARGVDRSPAAARRVRRLLGDEVVRCPSGQGGVSHQPVAQARQAYHRWIRACISQNLPYDRFARQLLLSSGSNFYDPPVNFYRAMQDRQPVGIAQTVALTFMGQRTEKWPQAKLAGLAAFFTSLRYKSTGEWKEEIVYVDPSTADKGSGPSRRYHSGVIVRPGPARGLRQLADLAEEPMVCP